MLGSAVRTPTVSADMLRVIALSFCVAVGAGGCAAAPTPQPRVLAVHKAPSLIDNKVHVPTSADMQEDSVYAESLSAEQVAAVVEARSSAVGGCHVVEYSGRQPEAGFVVVDLDIERNGAVSNAAISESSYRHSDLPSCVASVASGLTFPRAAHATQVSWRFDFKGR